MKTRRRLSDPLRTGRALVDHRRSAGNDVLLATILAAIAGAANAGGFFALGKYTSHMTGYLSQLADNLAIWNLWAVWTSALAIGCFIAGAAFSTVLINWARHEAVRRQFALPVALQGVLMLGFSFAGGIGALPALGSLCFIMGMQNATITKISGARIRTTHATGMITDIGIELGRWVYARLRPGAPVRTDSSKLRLLTRLVLSFLLGGLTGALGYNQIGYFFSLPLGLVLLSLGLPALVAEWRGSRRRQA